jgi:small subunit ribosomal protein S20
MANTKSAAKRARQSMKRMQHNRGVRTRLRNLQKQARSQTRKDPAQLSALISALDKAAKRGIIHRNAARRRKARLTALIASQK